MSIFFLRLWSQRIGCATAYDCLRARLSILCHRPFASRPNSQMMRFVFTKLFYALLAAGLVLLSLSWQWPYLRRMTLAYDLLLLAAAFIDARVSRWPAAVTVEREFAGRFHIGAETEVRVVVQSNSARTFRLRVKDEYPPELKLKRRARLSCALQVSRARHLSMVSRRRSAGATSS